MSELSSKYDDLLGKDGPAAIVLKQWFKPVGDEIFFPPTYASSSREKGSEYNIDRDVCVIDSVGSQANRMEPALGEVAEGKLVPKIIINQSGSSEIAPVNLLTVGHRAGDALVRFSSIGEDLADALKQCRKGDFHALAKLAPTSLIFGVWDSRGTQVKIPRLINSVIRAYGVEPYHRSATYFPPIKYAEVGVIAGEGDKKASTEGFVESPSTGALGGITAREIRRDASLNLCSLRAIGTSDKDKKLLLQRYVLGLALVALTYFDGKVMNLRQGCQLVIDPNESSKPRQVMANGSEGPFEISHEEAISYAVQVASEFEVGVDRVDVVFDPKQAQDALRKGSNKSKKGSGGKSAEGAQ